MENKEWLKRKNHSTQTKRKTKAIPTKISNSKIKFPTQTSKNSHYPPTHPIKTIEIRDRADSSNNTRHTLPEINEIN